MKPISAKKYKIIWQLSDTVPVPIVSIPMVFFWSGSFHYSVESKFRNLFFWIGGIGFEVLIFRTRSATYRCRIPKKINFYLQTRRAREAGVQSEKRVGVHQQDSLAVLTAGPAAQVASYYDPAVQVASSCRRISCSSRCSCRRISCSSREFLPPDQLFKSRVPAAGSAVQGPSSCRRISYGTQVASYYDPAAQVR